MTFSICTFRETKIIGKYPPPKSNETLMGYKINAFAYKKLGYALIYFLPFFKLPQRVELHEKFL